MPLMQRLRLDDEIGFNYEYMGYTEFEFGADRIGRAAIARAFVRNEISSRRTSLTFYTGGYNNRRLNERPIDVIIMTTHDIAGEIGDTYAIRCDRCPARTENPNTVGWMNVCQPRDYDEDEFIPMIILRADAPDLTWRVNRFFEDIISAARAELTVQQEAS